MDALKEAFKKIKEDIKSLRDAVYTLSLEINNLQTKPKTSTFSYNLNDKIYIPKTNFNVFYTSYNPDNQPYINQQTISEQTDRQTQKQGLEGLKTKKEIISTRNKGVQTDRQTHRQTDNQPNEQENSSLQLQDSVSQTNEFKRANEMINSLDTIKEEIRIMLRQLTIQEMAVFTTIYSLEEEKCNEITYEMVALRLNLTQSSIRDYVTKLIQKGIPIQKVKYNNKKILLSIDHNLKKIAPLSAIIQFQTY